MTELRSIARLEGVTPQLTPPPGPRRVLQSGLLGLGLGGGLTWLAVARADGVLGFVSLMLVLGSLAWIGLGLVRHFSARFRGRA